MATSRQLAIERVIDYAWSAWSELGVSGWKSDSFAACVDIEALVFLTGCLGDAEPRLRDESIDWCVSNVSWVSRSRLAHIVRDGTPNSSWSAYAGTLQRETKQPWPASSEPFDWRPSGKSRLPSLAHGSTLALRCRGLLGTTARSEIVRMLLLEDAGRAFDIRDLASEIRYTKRGVAEALDGLTLAGVVKATTVGNTGRYALSRIHELSALLGPMPRIRSSQRALCRIAGVTILAAEELSTASERVVRVEGARILSELEHEIRRVDPNVVLPTRNESTLDFLQAWSAAHCDAAIGRMSQ
jgi:hypothetical protein